MVMLKVFGSNTAAIFVTCPTLTPLNSTGEPTDSPVIEPEKYMTNVSRFWKNLPEPKTVMPAAASATAPTTNAPMSVFLACLPTVHLLPAGQEGPHPRILRSGQELFRVARGDHRLALAVEEHRVVGDGEDLVCRSRHVFLKGQGDVLRQGHRAPERASLVEQSEASHQPLALRRRHLPKASAGALVGDRPPGGFLKADQVPEQRALAAATPSHDDEDLPLVHGEVEVLHHDRVAVGHGEVAHRDPGMLKCRGHR